MLANLSPLAAENILVRCRCCGGIIAHGTSAFDAMRYDGVWQI